jgi:hypothetical protein
MSGGRRSQWGGSSVGWAYLWVVLRRRSAGRDGAFTAAAAAAAVVSVSVFVSVIVTAVAVAVAAALRRVPPRRHGDLRRGGRARPAAGQRWGRCVATRHARVPRGCQCRLLSSQGCVAQCHPATASLPVGPFQWVWQALGAGAGRGKRYAAGCVSHVRQWAHVCGGCAMCNNARRRRHHQQLARRGAAEPDRAQDVLETEEVAAAGR